MTAGGSATQPRRSGPVKVNWEGSLFVHHSLGMVNREILVRLLSDPLFSLRHVPFEPDRFAPPASSPFSVLHQTGPGPHHDAAVHVRHRWPPDFSPPSSGAYVFFQPWEYGALPVEWVEKVPRVAEEVWVYSGFLRECYLASGLKEGSVQVIPLGVDEQEFRPDTVPAPGLRSMIGERFCFFYNGGITLRKGVDILINAYLSEFGRSENVCLVIKGSSAYKKDLAEKVAALAERNDIAPVLYLTEDVLPNELPSLYAACDCYVHPYRAEGYGLPVAEAMACGKPVIVTGAGACRDFTSEEESYLIRCKTERFSEWSVSGIRTMGSPFWLLPDTDDLRRIMRHVFGHRDEAKAKGRKASEKIRKDHTWKQTVEAVRERILKIAD
jgi:glycosyltransferase involved in cell wall biosynthesis